MFCHRARLKEVVVGGWVQSQFDSTRESGDLCHGCLASVLHVSLEPWMDCPRSTSIRAPDSWEPRDCVLIYPGNRLHGTMFSLLAASPWYRNLIGWISLFNFLTLCLQCASLQSWIDITFGPTCQTSHGRCWEQEAQFGLAVLEGDSDGQHQSHSAWSDVDALHWAWKIWRLHLAGCCRRFQSEVNLNSEIKSSFIAVFRTLEARFWCWISSEHLPFDRRASVWLFVWVETSSRCTNEEPQVSGISWLCQRAAWSWSRLCAELLQSQRSCLGLRSSASEKEVTVHMSAVNCFGTSCFLWRRAWINFCWIHLFLGALPLEMVGWATLHQRASFRFDRWQRLLGGCIVPSQDC